MGGVVAAAHVRDVLIGGEGGIAIQDLPTVGGDGDGPGVVEYTKGKSITVQCSACLRTATARDPHKVIVIEAWNFEPDSGENGHTLHRRCPDCRDARKHPVTEVTP